MNPKQAKAALDMDNNDTSQNAAVGRWIFYPGKFSRHVAHFWPALAKATVCNIDYLTRIQVQDLSMPRCQNCVGMLQRIAAGATPGQYKITNEPVTLGLLQIRKNISANMGYAEPPKWIAFCETLLSEGFELYLYEARQTYSKYITVCRGNRAFKVRFSDHPPAKFRINTSDCDFFVGVVPGRKPTNTGMAIGAVHKFFKLVP